MRVAGADKDRIRGMLSERARLLIRSFQNAAHAGNFFITQEKISLCVAPDDIGSGRGIDNLVDRLVELARILCRKGDPAVLICENYPGEEKRGVKILLLETLLSLGTRLKEGDPLIKKADADPDPEIRFLSARLSGRIKGTDDSGWLSVNQAAEDEGNLSVTEDEEEPE
jgi:hypothetical protein